MGAGRCRLAGGGCHGRGICFTTPAARFQKEFFKG
jgi:hypothetical protein